MIFNLSRCFLTRFELANAVLMNLQTRPDPSIAIVPLISIYHSFIAHYSILNYRFVSCSICCSIFASHQLMKNFIAFFDLIGSIWWWIRLRKTVLLVLGVHWISSDTSSTKNTAEFCVSFSSTVRPFHLGARFTRLSYSSCNSFDQECIVSAAVL